MFCQTNFVCVFNDIVTFSKTFYLIFLNHHFYLNMNILNNVFKMIAKHIFLCYIKVIYMVLNDIVLTFYKTYKKVKKPNNASNKNCVIELKISI